jgi:hypothetical protein
MDPASGLALAKLVATIASAIGGTAYAAKGAYDLGTSIKDRNAARNANPGMNQNQMMPTSQQAQQQGNFWEGRPASVDRYSKHTDPQQQLQNQLIEMLKTHLPNSTSGKSPMDELALRQFKEEILPSINANYQDSGYEQQSNAAGERLALGLAGQRQQFLNNALGTALEPSFGAIQNPREPGLRESLLSNPETYSNIWGNVKDLGGKAIDWYQDRQKQKTQANPGKTSVGANDFQIPIHQNSPSSNLGSLQNYQKTLMSGLNR